MPKFTVRVRSSPVWTSRSVTTAVPGTLSACFTFTAMAGSAATASTFGALPALRTKLYWAASPSLTGLPSTCSEARPRLGITFMGKLSSTVFPSMVTEQVTVATPIETAFMEPSADTVSTPGLLLVQTAFAPS